MRERGREGEGEREEERERERKREEGEETYVPIIKPHLTILTFSMSEVWSDVQGKA